jgi:hypothetical protein
MRCRCLVRTGEEEGEASVRAPSLLAPASRAQALLEMQRRVLELIDRSTPGRSPHRARARHGAPKPRHARLDLAARRRRRAPAHGCRAELAARVSALGRGVDCGRTVPRYRARSVVGAVHRRRGALSFGGSSNNSPVSLPSAASPTRVPCSRFTCLRAVSARFRGRPPVRFRYRAVARRCCYSSRTNRKCASSCSLCSRLQGALRGVRCRSRACRRKSSGPDLFC